MIISSKAIVQRMTQRYLQHTQTVLHFTDAKIATILDLSCPMLEQAKKRISALTHGKVRTIQGDIRNMDIKSETYDIVIAAAVLHHLREYYEWKSVFEKIYKSLVAGGSFWVSDLISQEDRRIQKMSMGKYGDYLKEIGGESYKNDVFEYVEKEDTPRSMTFQMELMKDVGFKKIEILHKNSVFGSFGAIK